MREQLTKTKRCCNFKNLFYHAPNGKKESIQLIPISEVAAKDDFLNIKNASRDDVLAAHRVPPQLMGMLPNNVGGFGDVEKAAMVFARNEIAPLQARMAHAINTWAGGTVCAFKPYLLQDTPS
jgi:capsid portal protein